MEQEKDAPHLESTQLELTSWKAIAHHLGVNIRTAQKWERDRGLPIRRPSGVRGGVSADITSIDKWKETLYSHRQLECSYRWPLGPKITVEIRFIGSELKPTHIDLLQQYLELFKASIPK